MLLTPAEVATILRVARNTVIDHRWREKVGLDATRIGGSLRFEADDVEKLIERGRVKTLPTVREHRGQLES